MGPEQATYATSAGSVPVSPVEEALTVEPHHNPRLELRCLGCGYGAISSELIRCPMCGDEAWDFAEWRPFSH
jgi:rubrerythrin